MRFAVDTDVMRAKCERLQWSVADLDWDAPGAEVVGEDERLALSGFMTDLFWIESLASLVFGAMRDQTEEPALRAIFDSFSKDEQRHADAELMLMRRWKIVAKNEIPAPNTNARNLFRALERAAGRVHPSVYSAIIPFTELVLDGALVRHLDARIEDPLCAEVFRKINADEARHLAVDFYMLERYGAAPPAENLGHIGRALVVPAISYGLLLGYVPLLARMLPNIWRMGLSQEQLFTCINRYIALGEESPAAARHPTYHLFRQLSRGIVSGKVDLMELLLRASDVADSLGLDLAPAHRPLGSEVRPC